jgi:predicted DNA-binding transcriptional regulator AlpA
MVRHERKDDEMTLNEQPMRLLGWDDLRARGIKDSKPTIYRKIKAGKFPAPVYPGKSPAWPEHEIDAHILGLIAQRDASTTEAA